MSKYLIGAPTVRDPSDPVIAHAIEAASQAHGVPYELLRAVAWVESRFSPTARNAKSGASGLFQLMPATAEGLGVDPFNPVLAADGAARLLLRWRKKYRGSWAHALAAYVWGPARVDRSGGYGRTDGWPAKVRLYVQRVLEGAGMPVPFSAKQIQIGGAAL